MNTELETRIMNAAKAGLVNAAHPADKDCIPELLYNDCETGEKVFCALEQELARCDAFCFSTAFITIGGLEALKPILRTLQEKGIPGRILTTDYLAFSEPAALDFLDSFDNIDVHEHARTGISHQGISVFPARSGPANHRVFQPDGFRPAGKPGMEHPSDRDAPGAVCPAGPGTVSEAV